MESKESHLDWGVNLPLSRYRPKKLSISFYKAACSLTRAEKLREVRQEFDYQYVSIYFHKNPYLTFLYSIKGKKYFMDIIYNSQVVYIDKLFYKNKKIMFQSTKVYFQYYSMNICKVSKQLL